MDEPQEATALVSEIDQNKKEDESLALTSEMNQDNKKDNLTVFAPESAMVNMETNEKSMKSEDNADVISVETIEVNLDHDQKSLFSECSSLRAGTGLLGNSNRIHNNSKSPPYLLEASDVFLDPTLYKEYLNYIIVEDTMADRLVKNLDDLKDLTRDRAIDGISAGEKAVFWFFNHLKKLTNRWIGHVYLLIILLAYASLGAVTFMMLENVEDTQHPKLSGSPEENKYNKDIDKVRKEVAEEIEKIVKNETMMKNNSDFFALIKNNLVAYEDQVSEYLVHVNSTSSTQTTWDFWNSFIYAGTVFTSIGYGHITPKTTAGRFATIIYALIGIPLFLLVLTYFGRILTTIIESLWMYVQNLGSRSVDRSAPSQVVEKVASIDAGDHPTNIENKPAETSPTVEQNETKSATESDEEFILPVSLALFILIFYMLCGAVVIQYLESWNYFESFYFVFISMSTIGFGDYVPNPTYTVYSIMYIIFGLSLTSMCINVVQLKLTDMFSRASTVLGKKMGLPPSDTDNAVNTVS